MIEIVLDVETTGLDPRGGDRITEIGCVELKDYIPTGRTFQAYINPERTVDAKSVEITGLTDAFLADKPVFAQVVESFVAFIGDHRLVAHNASFDRGFVDMELKRAGRAVTGEARWVDTLDIARTMFPGMHNSLDALCKRFSISLDSREKHGALLDSRLLAEVYLQLNGGRERSLDLTVDAAATDGAIAEARARPTRSGLSTIEERERHRSFVQELGADSIWSQIDPKLAGPAEKGPST